MPNQTKTTGILFKNYNNSKIKIFWIPAHTEIQGNERADQLAKSAANETTTSSLKVPYTDIKEILKLQAKMNTQDEILKEGQIKGVKYFKNFYDEKSKP